MTDYTNDPGQCGLSNGTTVTTGNSGGGTNTAFASITGTAPTIGVTAPPYSDSQDYEFAANTATTNFVQYTMGSTTTCALRMYIRFGSSLPSAAMQLMRAVSGCVLNYNSSGTKFYVTANGSVVYNSVVALTASTGYWVSLGHTINASTATINFSLWNAAGNTLLDSTTLTNQNTAAISATSALYGKLSASGNIANGWVIAGLKSSNTSASVIAPPSMPATGTLAATWAATGTAAGAATGAAAATFTITGTAQAAAAGTTAATFAATATPAAAATGTASATLTVAATAQGAATGTTSATWGVTATAQAAASGSTAATFTATASASGAAPATGTVALAFTTTGTAQGAASGTSAAAFTASGSASAGAAGAAAVTWTITGDATAVVAPEVIAGHAVLAPQPTVVATLAAQAVTATLAPSTVAASLEAQP